MTISRDLPRLIRTLEILFENDEHITCREDDFAVDGRGTCPNCLFCNVMSEMELWGDPFFQPFRGDAPAVTTALIDKFKSFLARATPVGPSITLEIT